MLTIVHLQHTKYTSYKVAYLWLLHKLSGGTGMLVDYLWLASYLLKHAVTIATTALWRVSIPLVSATASNQNR